MNPKRLIMGGAAGTVMAVAFVALTGTAGATDVDVGMQQGCVGTYQKQLTVQLVNHDHNATLPIKITDTQTGVVNLTLAPAGQDGSSRSVPFTNRTDKGDGGTGRVITVTSSQAHLHGTLTGTLNWTQYECGPGPGTSVPPETTTVPTFAEPVPTVVPLAPVTTVQEPQVTVPEATTTTAGVPAVVQRQGPPATPRPLAPGDQLAATGGVQTGVLVLGFGLIVAGIVALGASLWRRRSAA